MFGRWFGRRGPAVRDRVWRDGPACDHGLAAQVGLELDQGQCVLLLVRSAVDLPAFVQALAARAPRVADDAYAAADLQAAFTRPGVLGITRPDVLRPIAAARGALRPVPLHVHVRARDARRSADERLLTLLVPFAPASIVFHHGLDDALLQAHTRQLEPMLRALGMDPRQAIDSPLLTRVLQRAQRP